MNLQYGCQVSNRYTGYLDSSDYGCSAELDGKPINKRKIKKKRKPKYRKYANKAVNTDDIIETAENSQDEADAHVASDEAEMADKIDKDKTFEANDSSNAATASDAMTQTNTSIDSGKCTGTESTVDGQSSASDSKLTKWSDICFEEEKAMKVNMEVKMEAQAIHPLETDEQYENKAPAFKEHKVYPTTFFYNSNYRGLYRTDGHSLPDRRHSSFHKMATPDDARMKRRLGRRSSKRSPKIDTD